MRSCSPDTVSDIRCRVVDCVVCSDDRSDSPSESMLSLEDLSNVLIVLVSSVSDFTVLVPSVFEEASSVLRTPEIVPLARPRTSFTSPIRAIVRVSRAGLGVLRVEGGVDQRPDRRVGDEAGLHAEVDGRDDEVLRVEDHAERGRRVEPGRCQDAGPLDLGRAVRRLTEHAVRRAGAGGRVGRGVGRRRHDGGRVDAGQRRRGDDGEGRAHERAGRSGLAGHVVRDLLRLDGQVLHAQADREPSGVALQVVQVGARARVRLVGGEHPDRQLVDDLRGVVRGLVRVGGAALRAGDHHGVPDAGERAVALHRHVDGLQHAVAGCGCGDVLAVLGAGPRPGHREADSDRDGDDQREGPEHERASAAQGGTASHEHLSFRRETRLTRPPRRLGAAMLSRPQASPRIFREISTELGQDAGRDLQQPGLMACGSSAASPTR